MSCLEARAEAEARAGLWARDLADARTGARTRAGARGRASSDRHPIALQNSRIVPRIHESRAY